MQSGDLKMFLRHFLKYQQNIEGNSSFRISKCKNFLSSLARPLSRIFIYFLNVSALSVILSFKEELHNRFNLSLEERVKIFKHNSENLMKIGWKIRKLWHFEVSQIFTKHFLTSRYEYANEWVDDVITSLLAIYFVHKILKIVIFCPNLW